MANKILLFQGTFEKKGRKTSFFMTEVTGEMFKNVQKLDPLPHTHPIPISGILNLKVLLNAIK